MTSKRTGFDESVKAEIFCRDRATCSFTGACLWILDHGACWSWIMDWADHETPVSRGGKSVVGNGVCASWKANQRKSANGRDHEYWFHHGHPTWHYIYEQGGISKEISDRLKRFAKLQDSDWYLNRSIANFLLALNWRYWDSDYSRDENRYFKTSLRFLKDWRKALAHDDDERSLERRGILKRPLSQDMRLLLELRKAESVDDVKKLAKKVGPIYRANYTTFYEFLQASTHTRRKALLEKAKARARISPKVIRAMKDVLSTLDPKCGPLIRE